MAPPSQELEPPINPGRFRKLFARYHVSIYRWLLRSLGDAELAESLLNDVFLDVWRNAAFFDGRFSVSTWLLAIARTKALSAHPSKIHSELDELAHTVPTVSNEPELPPQVNRKEVLRQSLARLSRQYGEVIDLVYYHGKSVKEAAQIVGTDGRTVKSRMYDARRRLAEWVELRTYALALKTCSSRSFLRCAR
jgi:RNA polymerase sigma-70 factor, ECF subfamily